MESHFGMGGHPKQQSCWPWLSFCNRNRMQLEKLKDELSTYPGTQSHRACESKDFDGFFEAFVRSPEVRLEKTAKFVERRSTKNPSLIVGKSDGAQYQHSFNISLSDCYYADTVSMNKWKSGVVDWYEDVWVEITEVSDDTYRVDYSKAVLHDDGGGDSKTFIRSYGPKRAYVFEVQGDCWKLTQDLR